MNMIILLCYHGKQHPETHVYITDSMYVKALHFQKSYVLLEISGFPNLHQYHYSINNYKSTFGAQYNYLNMALPITMINALNIYDDNVI